MTLTKRQNLKRLLNPKHIAVIGGRDAQIALQACQRIGFKGPIWPVNPRRKTMAGIQCFSSVEDLPEPVDAVFLAAPPEPALGIVKQLSDSGAGGVVCYTAGFSDDGKQGGEADQPLVDVAGDLALVGPNCYGLINYKNKVALWPFAHGGYCPGYGAAIITQSGMLSSDITMNQRSLPLSYMVSAGNSSVLQLEDFIDVLCERDEVRSIGLHIEGLKNINSFSRVAYKALEYNKPIVVLKTGTSKIGSQLTISHTGSLSGTNELYQALFERLGIITVTNPAQMLETLKFLSIAGVPKSNRVMGFTCSGGGATMLADYGETINLDFPPPSDQVAAQLTEKLPVIADVTNPLDYTTPIWGQQDKVQAVFETALKDPYDVAVIVQDFPLEEVNESKSYYLNDATAFINATHQHGLPGVVCSTLPENIDQQTREMLIQNAVVPLQGIHDALDAIKKSICHGQQRELILSRPYSELSQVTVSSPCDQCDEFSSKAELKAAGFNIPHADLVAAAQAGEAAAALGYPVAVKMNSSMIAHKTEIGAIRLGLDNAQQVDQAVEQIKDSVFSAAPQAMSDLFIVEKMLERPLAELMLSIRHDDQFGLAMTLSSGGTLVELLGDSTTLLLPASHSEILKALEKLRVSQLLNGFRGQPAVNKDKLVETIQQIADYVHSCSARIAELEINPLFIYSEEFVIVDVLMQCFKNPEQSFNASQKDSP